MTFWETWDARECVSRHSTLLSARRACRNDEGRTLTIYDPSGRIAALYRDGRELQAAADLDAA